MANDIENLDERVETVELDNHSVCYITYNGDHLRSNQMTITLSHKRTNVAVFAIRSSQEFLTTLFGILTRATKCFVDIEDNSKVKIGLKVKKGMCKLTIFVKPNVKVKHAFPVDDDFSWGKMSCTIGEWERIDKKISTF